MKRTDCPSPLEDGWEPGFREHDRAQRRRLAKLSFRQKLEWLDEVDRFIERLKAARRLYHR